MTPPITASVAGRHILYTGAAGGLGADATLAFLAAGARVFVIDNDPGKCDRLAERASADGLNGLEIRRSDLADHDALALELEQAQADLGGFDIVINNAAIYPSKPFEEYSLAEQQAVQAVNVDAAIVCVMASLPHMREQEWGRIINIASITAFGGWDKLSPYVQSKGALIGLTRAWAREFGKYGITVNAVAPGAFPTDAEKIHPDPEAYVRFVIEHQSVKRRGTPTDIAAILSFLASEQAGFITGQTINVDGGWVMH